MIAHIRRTAAVTALAFLAACGAERDLSTGTSAVLSDGRTDGAPGFHFLPPVAPEPDAKENERGLAPVVEIVALTPGAPVLATFSGDAVRGSESHYMVHWSTKEFPPDADTTYRIRVLLDGALLGHADAQVARNGRDLRFLASQDVFGLTGKRTVPIKFRIDLEEDPCLDVECPPLDECNTGACDPESGCFFTPVPDSTNCTLPSGFPGACVTIDGVGVCVEFAPAMADAPTRRMDPAALGR